MDRHYSGISEYALNLLKELLEKDKRNNYKFFYNSARDCSNQLPVFKPSVPILKTGYPNKFFNYIMQKGLKYPKLDQLLDIDVFYAPHFNFFSFSANKNVKKIITVHDLSFLRYPNFFSLRKNIWHFMLGIKKILNEFDIIVAISENTKRDILYFFKIPEEKIRVIYSGVGLEFEQLNKKNPKLEAVREKYALPKNFIFHLGTIEPRKNIIATVDAFESYVEKNPDSNLQLVLAGANGWRNRKIFSYINCSKYKNRIKYIGYIDRADKKYLYNLARVFLFPSFYEGFGFPPLEAFRCGTPVIAGANSGIPEVAGDKAIMVDPYNTSEIFSALSVLLDEDAANFQYLREEGTEIRDFSWKKTALEYLKLY